MYIIIILCEQTSCQLPSFYGFFRLGRYFSFTLCLWAFTLQCVTTAIDESVRPGALNNHVQFKLMYRIVYCRRSSDSRRVDCLIANRLVF